MFGGMRLVERSFSKLLVISAHPLAGDVGAGGFMCKCVDDGVETYLAVMSSGEKGIPETAPSELGPLREEEQRAAAKVLGVTDVFFLGFPDTEILDTIPTRLKLVEAIRGVRPDIVLTHSEMDTHPDHKATATATFAAAMYSSLPSVEAGSKPPHLVKSVFTYGLPGYTVGFVPEIYLDITGVVERKIKAISCYKTTVEHLGWPIERWVDTWLLQDRLYGSSSGVRFAEGFRSFWCSHLGRRAFSKFEI
jgi:LmbE family N-acetylglucosaminyl deacetylase